MNEKGKNVVASVRQRLINISKERREDPNLIFIRYAIERFLFRLSRSSHSDKFILKGAMLWAIWAGKPHRPTKDLDLLGFGNASSQTLQTIFSEICNVIAEPDWPVPLWWRSFGATVFRREVMGSTAAVFGCETEVFWCFCTVVPFKKE